MNPLVLSGTDPIVLSGTGSSCYRGPKPSLTRCYKTNSGSSNFTNIESFGFYLTDRAEIHIVDNPQRSPPKGVMIVALLHPKRGVGKITLSLHHAGFLAHRCRRLIFVDANPHGYVLDQRQKRAKIGLPSVFGFSRNTFHHEASEIAKDVDHFVIDGPPRMAALLHSARLATDWALVPAQHPPFNGWASSEMLRIIDETRMFSLELAACFVLNRRPARANIVRETALALASYFPAIRSACIRRQVIFANAARRKRLIHEAPQGVAAVQKRATLADKIERLTR